MAKIQKGDLTEGPIAKKLILFALPLLVGSLVQQLYNTVDLIYVGNFIGKSASAAIGASSLLITCLVGFFGGMSVGSGVVISQVFGAKDPRRLSKAVHNTVALSLAGGLALMAIGYVIAPWFIRVINTPESIRAGRPTQGTRMRSASRCASAVRRSAVRSISPARIGSLARVMFLSTPNCMARPSTLRLSVR